MSEAQKKFGRPRNTEQGGMPVLIYIPKELREKLRELGGSAWIVEQLRKAKRPVVDSRQGMA